jgi:hypothetical protein
MHLRGGRAIDASGATAGSAPRLLHFISTSTSFRRRFYGSVRLIRGRILGNFILSENRSLVAVVATLANGRLLVTVFHITLVVSGFIHVNDFILLVLGSRYGNFGARSCLQWRCDLGFVTLGSGRSWAGRRHARSILLSSLKADLLARSSAVFRRTYS